MLKEGLYEDRENRDRILAVSRFHTTAGDGLVSLDAYVDRMLDGQEAIYTISGEDGQSLRQSPQLEGFAARGVEVLLLTDPVDEFWVPTLGSYRDKPFKSATRGGTDLGKITAREDAKKVAKKAKKKKAPAAADVARLTAAFKAALGDAVKDVRASERLTDSPVCLVADEADLDMHLERLLKQHRQMDVAAVTPRILEVNPRHALIRRLADLARDGDGADGVLADAALLLLDHARIVEGEPIPDPAAFSRRLASMMEKGLVA